MLRALYPTSLRSKGPFPELSANWPKHRPEPRQLEVLRELTGAPGEHLPMLYPQVLGFPLLMAMLTHPSLPLPIWRTLQIRNHLFQRRPIPRGVLLDFQAGLCDQRVLEKGVEIDLRMQVSVEGEPLWQSVSTFYYRGRFGSPGPGSPLAVSPKEYGEQLAKWRTERGGGVRFGKLSGDFNGVHLFGWYARLLGFGGAFHHPPVLLAQCLKRLSPIDERGARLDLWIKGPVQYGSEVSLRTKSEDGTRIFALTAESEQRPALVGRLFSGEPLFEG